MSIYFLFQLITLLKAPIYNTRNNKYRTKLAETTKYFSLLATLNLYNLPILSLPESVNSLAADRSTRGCSDTIVLSFPLNEKLESSLR